MPGLFCSALCPQGALLAPSCPFHWPPWSQRVTELQRLGKLSRPSGWLLCEAEVLGGRLEGWSPGHLDPCPFSHNLGTVEKEMAAHSSILAWRIPWTEEPGRLQFMGSQESDMA